MQTIKFITISVLAFCAVVTTTAQTAAATRVGTIVFVNAEMPYDYYLYGTGNTVVSQGQISDHPAVGEYEIGVYRYEIQHPNGKIEQAQFTLAPGQQIFITGNLTLVQVGSTVGATTVRVDSGGATSQDHGQSYAFETTTVDTSQFGATVVPVVREVTSADAAQGVEKLLQDNIVPITGANDETQETVPVLTVKHETAYNGAIKRTYMVDDYLVDFTVGNVMCTSELTYRDFKPCDVYGTHTVLGVIDPAGDLVFSGVEKIKVIGKVQAGDKLVAAGVAGFATVDNNARHGSIIGVARTAFDGDKGIVTATIGKQ